MGGMQSVGWLAEVPDMPAPAPPPGWLETVGLEFQSQRVGPDYGKNQIDYMGRIRSAIRSAMEARGYQPRPYDANAALSLSGAAGLGGIAPTNVAPYVVEGDDFWKALAEARRRDPKFLSEYADVRDEASLWRAAEKRRAEETKALDRRLEGAPWTGRLVGGLGYGLSQDPLNAIPIAGPELGTARTIGGQLLKAGARGALVNVGIQAPLEIPTYYDAKNLGIEYGAPEIALNLGTAGILGAGFDVLGTGIHALANGRAAARAGTTIDRGVADAIEGLTPEGRTPNEQSVINVLRRSADIAEANPFEGPGGLNEHVARLDAAQRSHLADDVVAGGAAHPARPSAPHAGPLTRRDIIGFVQDKLEGGATVVHFSDADGGTTKYGIAQRYHPGVDVANLSAEQAAEIARRDYWWKELDNLDSRTAAVAFDAGYISNRDVAERIIRESGGDFQKALDLYRAHLNRIADTVEGKAKFKRGWNNRVDKLARFLGGAEGGPAAPVPEAFDAGALADLGDTARILGPAGDEQARAGWIGDSDGPILRPDQFGSADEHRAAQEALEAELAAERGAAEPRTPETVEAEARDPNAATPRPGEYGGPDNPGEDILANRKFQPPVDQAEALARLDERLKRIEAAGKASNDPYHGLDYTDRVLLNAMFQDEVERVGKNGKPRKAATIARELENSGFLSGVLQEEIGTIVGRDDLVKAAARYRPEIFPHEYRAEQATITDRPAWAIDADTLRDRILARREGRELPPLPPLREDVAPPEIGPEEAAKLAAWDQPGGQAGAEQVASLEHDLRMSGEAATATEPGAPEPRSVGVPEEAAEPIATFTDTAPGGRARKGKAKSYLAKLKAHPDFEAAKAGDVGAAARLVEDLVTVDNLKAAGDLGGARFVPVAAAERGGRNVIPQALAAHYADAVGGTVDNEIVQSVRANHTDAGGVERLARRPQFDGPVEPGADYVLVDDVATLGGTVAELAAHIRRGGGNVKRVVLLANGAGRLVPDPAVLASIEKKGIADVIRERFGIEPAALTDAEARFADKFSSAERFRNKVVERLGEGDAGGAGAAPTGAPGEGALAAGVAPERASGLAPVMSGQSGATLDELLARAAVNQTELEKIGPEIAAATGAEFRSNGAKEPERVREKIATEDYSDPGDLKDLARAAFVVTDEAQARAVVDALGERFPLFDKGWQQLPNGYVDRKLIVRLANGGVAELQLVPRQIAEYKFGAGGKLYDATRRLAPSDPQFVANTAAMRERYAALLEGSEFMAAGNAARAASGESSTPSSSALEASAVPGASDQPVRSLKTEAASPSTETNLSSTSNNRIGADIGAPPDQGKAARMAELFGDAGEGADIPALVAAIQTYRAAQARMTGLHYQPAQGTYKLAELVGAPRLVDYLAEQLGTRQWVVAPRLSKRLKAQGYEVAVRQGYFTDLQRQWENAVLDRAAAGGKPEPVAPEATGPAQDAAGQLRLLEERDGFTPEGMAQSPEDAQKFEAELRRLAREEAGAAEPPRYRLNEDGPELTLQQILDRLDDNDRAIAAVRACLAPGAGAP